MHVFRLSIGAMKTSILLAGLVLIGTVHAADSASFILISDTPNGATQNTGVSTSFQLLEAQQTWNAKPLGSTHFQLTTPGGGQGSETSSSASSVSSLSSSATNENSGTNSSTTAHGSRGERAGNGVDASLGTTSSLSSSRQSSASAHAQSSPASSSSLSLQGNPGNDNLHPAGTTGEHLPPSRSEDVTLHTLNTFTFFGSTDPLCEEVSDRMILSTLLSRMSLWVWLGAAAAMVGIGLCARLRSARSGTSKRTRRSWRMLAGTCFSMSIFLVMLLCMTRAFAAETVPSTNIYNGRLLDSSGQPITTSHTVRFSYWKSVDFVSTDLTGAGAIETSAVNYAGWQEAHTVTPNALGYFSVQLGSTNALPNFATLPTQILLNLFLQVDVKAAANPDTSYELLDSDPTDTAIDRSGVLSVPFAENADMIDQREIGTGSGNIAILGANGTLPVSTTPAGTNTSGFTIDADNSEISDITLTFGAALEKKLTYDISDSTFRFNDDLEVQGNLTVTGLINGVNISTLQAASDSLKASSGGGLNVNVSAGSYRLNGEIMNYGGGTITLPGTSTNKVFFASGGLTYASALPTDESSIPVADVTTSAGSIVTILDRRVVSSDDREMTRSIVFNPGYEKASYQGDGGDNIGQLSLSHDNISLKNFYVWTSTKSSLQDHDIILRVPVPDHFVRWQNTSGVNPISLQYRTTSAANTENKLDVQIYDTSGVPVSLSGSVTGLSNTSWSTSEVEFTGTPTWTPGQDMLLRFKVFAKDNAQIHLGSLKLQFVELE